MRYSKCVYTLEDNGNDAYNYQMELHPKMTIIEWIFEYYVKKQIQSKSFNNAYKIEIGLIN